MKTIYVAAALAAALPAVAHAQTGTPAPAPTPAQERCCCEEMMRGHGDHAMGRDMHPGHDMSQHQQQQAH